MRFGNDLTELGGVGMPYASGANPGGGIAATPIVDLRERVDFFRGALAANTSQIVAATGSLTLPSGFNNWYLDAVSIVTSGANAGNVYVQIGGGTGYPATAPSFIVLSQAVVPSAVLTLALAWPNPILTRRLQGLNQLPRDITVWADVACNVNVSVFYHAAGIPLDQSF